jgi:hypothetical protein
MLMVKYLRQLEQTNTSYFEDYFETSSESLCDTIIDHFSNNASWTVSQLDKRSHLHH